jgi:hypothetical protein
MCTVVSLSLLPFSVGLTLPPMARLVPQPAYSGGHAEYYWERDCRLLPGLSLVEPALVTATARDVVKY